MTKVFLNKQLVESQLASISINDQGFTCGHGVFETLVARHGRVLAFDLHYKRLLESARIIGGLRISPAAELEEKVYQLMADNGCDTGVARIRITYTAGSGAIGMDLSQAQSTELVSAIPAELTSGCASLHVYEFRRNERAALMGAKSTAYSENLVALSAARAHGCDEALFLNTQDQLCEGSGSNLFVKISDKWVTPPLSSGCLAGVTRQLVLDLAKSAEIEIIEREIFSNEMANIQAAFLTGTMRGVQLVERIGGYELPAEADSELSQLMAQYDQLY